MRHDTVQYRLEIVGGPYDGSHGLMWVHFADDDADPELPAVIVLGCCPGDRRCRLRACSGDRHVAYWIPEHEPVPMGVGQVEYLLDENSVQADGPAGTARYVKGGLVPPARLAEREFAGAGMRTAAFGLPFGAVVEVNRDGRAVRVRLWEVS